MPVDVFGRTSAARGGGAHVVFRGLTITQANDVFLRRDGSNAMTNDIDLDSHKLINVADPTDGGDAANKKYVDTNAGPDSGLNKVSKSGDTMTGDLLLAPSENSNRRILGCVALAPGKIFTVALGSRQNIFQYTEQIPLTLETSQGLLVRTRNEDICRIGNLDGSPAIQVYKDIALNSNRILFLTEPAFPHEAVSRDYVDRKFVNFAVLNYEGHIPQLEQAVSKSGFIASSSSNLSRFTQAFLAFNLVQRGEWKTAQEGVGAWIQISCPTAVRIWKIRLTGLNENRITSWKLGGGTGESNELTDIYTSEATLGPTMQDFPMDPHRAYNIYRLTVLSVEPGTRDTGLAYFQIFIKSRYAYID